LNLPEIMKLFGFIFIGILVFVIVYQIYKIYKIYNKADTPLISITHRDYSSFEIAETMIKLVCEEGYFSLHCIGNSAEKFNDKAHLEEYKEDIEDSFMINYIKNIEGKHGKY